MASLCEELKRPNKNHEMIKQLLKLTFCLRRKEITAEYDRSATSLIDHYFFFKTKKWVSSYK